MQMRLFMNRKSRVPGHARHFLISLSAWLLLGGTAASADPPNVVVSIKPIEAIVGAVMRGVGTPYLIIRGSGSPHSYPLRPSDARALSNADVIFRVGPDLDVFLEKPLAAIATKATIVTSIDVEGLTLWPLRTSGHWKDHGATHGAIDSHVWLDPTNAAAMARAAAEALGAIDSTNAAIYRANATQFGTDLDALDAELRGILAPVRELPYVVFHDAYQYFERAYSLNAVGAVTISPERAPGARRITEIRAVITGLDARCLFSEPQFEPAIAATIVEDTGARTGVLDPLGAAVASGSDGYLALLRGLARALVDCLAAPDKLD